MDKVSTLCDIGLAIATVEEAKYYSDIPLDPDIIVLDPPAGTCIDPTTFLAYRLDDEEVIGASILYNRDFQTNSIEYGVRIWNSSNWGKGYGTKINQMTLVYAFNTVHVLSVTLKVVPYNTRAIRSYEKSGFVLLRHEYIDGILFNRMVAYGIVT